MNSTFTVDVPGLSTTIQDLGRFGYYHLGIPQSGAMDNYSAQAANALAGNPKDAAFLEATFMAPTLTFKDAAIVAVTGADAEVKVNGESVEPWSRIDIPAGGELSFGFLTAGARLYIAIRGGVDVPVVFGSRSTYPLGGLGGFKGRKLAAGDTLQIGEATGSIPSVSTLPVELRPSLSRKQIVRVLPGLYDHKLTETGRSNLLTGEWSLTPVADRGGLRYQGPGVEWKDEPQPFGAGSDPSNIVDAGYAVGSIQIPGGTQPIVLHRDAVSGGGYAAVATVISADMDIVSRATPGTTTHFKEVTMEEALAARNEYNATLDKLWETIQ